MEPEPDNFSHNTAAILALNFSPYCCLHSFKAFGGSTCWQSDVAHMKTSASGSTRSLRALPRIPSRPAAFLILTLQALSWPQVISMLTKGARLLVDGRWRCRISLSHIQFKVFSAVVVFEMRNILPYPPGVPIYRSTLNFLPVGCFASLTPLFRLDPAAWKLSHSPSAGAKCPVSPMVCCLDRIWCTFHNMFSSPPHEPLAHVLSHQIQSWKIPFKMP